MVRPFAASLVLCLMATAASAQPQAVHKTTLQSLDFPPPVYRTVTVSTRVDPGGLVARHTHPGVEMAYVVQGRALVQVEGRPDQRLGPGGSFSVAPATPHSVRNLGPGALTILSTYVVDRSKPIATPAPLK